MSCLVAHYIEQIGLNEYRLGNGIIIRVDNDNDLPVIGKILKLYVINDEICFEVRMFNTQKLYVINDEICFEVRMFNAQKLYVINDEICFEVRMFNTQYEPHYRVYTFNDQAATSDIHYVYHSELLMQVPVYIHSSATFGSHKRLFILPYLVL